jgi:hypothetical protein
MRSDGSPNSDQGAKAAAISAGTKITSESETRAAIFTASLFRPQNDFRLAKLSRLLSATSHRRSQSRNMRAAESASPSQQSRAANRDKRSRNRTCIIIGNTHGLMFRRKQFDERASQMMRGIPATKI